jgi:hypothetical protein
MVFDKVHSSSLYLACFSLNFVLSLLLSYLLWHRRHRSVVNSFEPSEKIIIQIS